MLLGVAGLGAVGFIVFLLWLVPEWQVPSGVTDVQERAELEDQFRRTMTRIVAEAMLPVVGFLVYLWVSSYRTSVSSDKVRINNAWQTSINEWFTRAIEQLGSENTAVCLGGIYALERIARDSHSEHQQVMEVLTAYVREYTRWNESDAI